MKDPAPRDGKLWSRSRFGKAFLPLFVALSLAIGIGFLTSSHSLNAGSAAIPALAAPDRDPGSAQFPSNGTFSPLVKRTAPAVVSVQTVRSAQQQQMPSGFPFLFPFGQQEPGTEPPQRRERAAGSGVIVTPDGKILTNHHVVEDADQVTVILDDEREFPAEVIGSDEKTDIAVLQIKATGLPTMQFGNSDSVDVGDIVLAIGNPFGLGQTVTMGIVGATGRQFGIMAEQQGYEDFIQTDAAINPGNSGGPLINTRGELIGVNTAILSRSGANNGVGFAVPINLAHHVMEQLAEHGRVVRGYMGVGIQDVTPAMSKSLDTPDSRGAVVTTVEPDGPAESAGFKPYDVIREFDGKPVHDARQLRLHVANKAPGESVKVAVLRDGREQTLDITLGELPGSEEPARRSGHSESGALSGLSVEELTPAVAQRLGLPPNVDGVVVARVASGSPAADAGVQPGDVIEQVNRKPITSVSEFRAAVREAGDGALLMMVTNRRGSFLVTVEP